MTGRKLTRLFLVLILASAAVPAYADSIPLVGFGPFPFGPGDVLRAEFDAHAFLQLGLENNDVLVFSPAVVVIEPVESFTTRVFDRGQLLGTYTSTATHDELGLRFRSWFAAPGSMFTFGTPTHMDFSTLQDATFDGWIEFEITGGRINLFRGSDELDFDRALTPDIASGLGFAPRTYELIPASAPVPEPASLLLVGIAASSVALGRLSRRRERPS
jgi:hypothetical protein